MPWDEIVKGFEYEEGRWVTLTDDDFRAANVEATQTIDILGAVCREDVPVEYFDKPYYLEPSKAGRKAYALLRETLRSAGRVAVAKVVIRTRQHLALLVPEGDALLLELVRYPYELRGTAELDLPESDLAALGVTDAELAMAEQLVEAMEADVGPGRRGVPRHLPRRPARAHQSARPRASKLPPAPAARRRAGRRGRRHHGAAQGEPRGAPRRWR